MTQDLTREGIVECHLCEGRCIDRARPDTRRSTDPFSGQAVVTDFRLAILNDVLWNNMAMNDEYAAIEPARTEIDRLDEPTVIEFGSPWCGHCRAAQPLLASALAGHPRVRHIKIADGSGRPLGRSFGVKLWPTLVFLRQCKETARLVRPVDSNQIRRALAEIDHSG
jgi:thioredoxin 1